MNQPAIILVRPQMGENIGAAARIMGNFGLTDLRIVAPRDGWPNQRAIDMAAGSPTLEHVRVFETVEAAISDLQKVYASTARLRDIHKPVVMLGEGGRFEVSGVSGQASPPPNLPPQGGGRLGGAVRKPREPSAANEVSLPIAEVSRPEQGQTKIGILFGRERTGLENEDLACADAILQIPVNPEFGSLNLAQAVAVIVYELVRGQKTESSGQRHEESPLATKGGVQHLMDFLEAELDARNFWKVPEKKPAMWLNLRNCLTRMEMTEQELRTLHGVIRCLAKE